MLGSFLALALWKSVGLPDDQSASHWHASNKQPKNTWHYLFNKATCLLYFWSIRTYHPLCFKVTWQVSPKEVSTEGITSRDPAVLFASPHPDHHRLCTTAMSAKYRSIHNISSVALLPICCRFARISLTCHYNPTSDGPPCSSLPSPFSLVSAHSTPLCNPTSWLLSLRMIKI